MELLVLTRVVILQSIQLLETALYSEGVPRRGLPAEYPVVVRRTVVIRHVSMPRQAILLSAAILKHAFRAFQRL